MLVPVRIWVPAPDFVRFTVWEAVAFVMLPLFHKMDGLPTLAPMTPL